MVSRKPPVIGHIRMLVIWLQRRILARSSRWLV